MKRREYYNKMFDFPMLAQLQEIKTMGELSKHIGEILYFEHIRFNWYSWMGVLDGKTFDIIRTSDCTILERRIHMTDSLFIKDGGDIVNVFDKDSSKVKKERFNFQSTDSCNGQGRILVPNPKMISYYNFCKTWISMQPKNNFLIQ